MAARDFAICVAVLVVVFILAGAFDLGERWHAWAVEHEHLELDEILIALAFGSTGISWYAFRRWRDASREAERRRLANIALTREISARRLAESEREKAELLIFRLGQIVEDSINEIYVFDAETLKFLQVNSSASRNTGYTQDELLDLTPLDLKPEISRDEFEQLIALLKNGEERYVQFSTIHRRKDGSDYDVEVLLQLISSPSQPVYAAIIEDVTEKKAAEERLRKAQKMEAVGQLTGGIAHDFNNLLAVIQGNIELLSIRGRVDTSLTEPIVRASERGAELTQRLLAFSRQQPLSPRPIQPGELVSDMRELLSRTLGESIEIKIEIEADLADAMADPGQVENALLNLALNARDAMAGSGTLTIGCANAVLDEAYVANNPEAVIGDYVAISVSDTGTGMSPEVKAQVFEPFFTTKDVGEGSGLGLSMVYGFARQSGGHVSLYSEQGQGTTVKLYLPKSSTGERQSAHAIGEPEVPIGSGETILVIEDDPDLAELAAEMLDSLNYKVVHVSSVAEARDTFADAKQFDLVLSDVVLPGGVSGPDFAKEISITHPDTKIIFMSGYPAEAARSNGFLDDKQTLLNKPFRRKQLAEAVHNAMT